MTNPGAPGGCELERFLTDGTGWRGRVGSEGVSALAVALPGGSSLLSIPAGTVRQETAGTETITSARQPDNICLILVTSAMAAQSPRRGPSCPAFTDARPR